MNKQEAIKKLNAKKDENENIFELEDWDTGLKCGARGAYENAIFIVKQLDEPEKPLLTKEEAEWLEKLKESKSYLNKYDLLYFISRQGFGYTFSFKTHGEEIVLKDDDNDYRNDEKVKERLVNAVLYGYEVGKEKLYKVSFKRNGIGIGVQQQDGSFKERFAKEELSEYGFDNLDVYEVEEVEE